MAQNNMNRGLNSRHISMIAIGGAIGTGLFCCNWECHFPSRTWWRYISLFDYWNYVVFPNVIDW